jgi:hypothetical protein
MPARGARAGRPLELATSTAGLLRTWTFVRASWCRFSHACALGRLGGLRGGMSAQWRPGAPGAELGGEPVASRLPPRFSLKASHNHAARVEAGIDELVGARLIAAPKFIRRP